MRTVVLVWQDGREERTSVDDWSVRDGCLRLYNHGSRATRSIPLANLREWRIEP